MTRAAMIEGRPGRQPRGVRFASDDEMVTSRLREVLEPLCVSEIARQTGVSRQTIHRYIAGDPATASFLVRLCEVTETSAEWLLLGRGAQRRADAVAGHLAQASASELCAALARQIDRPPQPKTAFRPRLVRDRA